MDCVAPFRGTKRMRGEIARASCVYWITFLITAALVRSVGNVTWRSAACLVCIVSRHSRILKTKFTYEGCGVSHFVDPGS